MGNSGVLRSKGQSFNLGGSVEDFADWCDDKLGGADRLDLVDLQPIGEEAEGRAGELFIFTLKNQTTDETRKYLLRRKPAEEYLVHLDHDFLAEFLFQEQLGSIDLPMASARAYESDKALLGEPFYVSDFIEGQVPPGETLHTSGWVADLGPEDQRLIAENSLKAMAGLHNLDPAKFDFGHVYEREKVAGSYFGWHIDYWRRYSAWASGDKYPTALQALDWLSANKPGNERLSISWGDARPGNTIYQGVEVAAMIDWDMAGLGAAEKDLAWWLVMDEYMINWALNVPLPGWPTVPEKIRIYESVYEHPINLESVNYYSVYAMMAAALFTHRVMTLSPDVNDEIIAGLMTDKTLSPMILLQDIMEGKMQDLIAGK